MVDEEEKPKPKAKVEPENLGPSKDTLDLAKALQQILDQNLDINRQNTAAIKDSVSIARDLSTEYAVTNEQQLKINQANRMSSTLNADINAYLKT